MKLSHKFLAILLPIFAGFFANGQSIIKNEETIFVRQDSVVEVSVKDYRGSLVWQKSEDGLNWVTLSENTADSLLIVPDHDGFYRAAIVVGACDTAYSDTIRLKAKVLDGKLELPPTVNTNHIIIHSIFDSAVPDSEFNFSINVESILVAFDTLLQKSVYYGFPDVSEDDNYKLNAKETALYFCLLTIPNIRRPEYRPYIKEIKDLFYEFEEVQRLEEAIEECIASKGYFDFAYLSEVLSSSLDSMLSKLEVDNFYIAPEDNATKTKSATASTSSPLWNTFYHGPFRVSDAPIPSWSDKYDSETNTYELKRTFYNSSNAVVGVTTGTWDQKLRRGTRNDAYIGFIEPYFPPDMLTLEGNIENLSQLYQVLRGVKTHGFYQGLVQSDAYSKQQAFIFKLKENEKDAFIFENGYYDNLMKGINVIYFLLDFLLSQATWISSGNDFSDDLINEFLKDMIGNPSTLFLNYPTLYAEGKFNLITEDILDRFTKFTKHYNLNYEISEASVNHLFKSIVKDVAERSSFWYTLSRRFAISSVGAIAFFDSYNAVSIPVSFDDAAFPPQPSNPSPHAIQLDNLETIHFSWGLSGLNLGYKFNIYFSDDPQRILNLDNSCKIASNLNLTQFYYSNYFPSNKLFYWRVEVLDVNGKKTFGPLWYFRIGDQSQVTSPNFEITPSSGTIYTDFIMDATNAMVFHNDSIESQFRWDFDGDGEWDQSWSTNKVTIHRYDTTGTYTVKLEISGYAGYNIIFSKKVVVTDVSQPTVETKSITEIQSSSATSGGNVVSDGGAPLLSRGVCWSTSPDPTISNNKTVNGSSLGSYASYLTNLQPNTPYYVRAYATSSYGTGYGLPETFTTSAALPQVSTKAASNITETSVTLNASVVSDGGSEILQRGFYWCQGDKDPVNTDFVAVVSGALGSYSKNLSGLKPGTLYSFKSFATNSIGTVTGNVYLFATNSPTTAPSVTTLAATDITKESAKLNGTVVSDGGAAITERGFYWSSSITNPGPENGGTKVIVSGTTGNYNYILSGLQSNTSYYFTAYAKNNKGTTTGQSLALTTSQTEGPVYGSFTDTRDGKVYKTVKIGGQTWMAENLAYLPSVSPPTQGSETAPYYYVYNYSGTNITEATNSLNYATYGVLYNWPAAMNGASTSSAVPSGVQGACPAGWHLPSDNEWTILTDYLQANGFGYEGSGKDIAKSIASKTNWNSSTTPGSPGNNPAANNDSGFSGLPSGCAYDTQFSGLGVFLNWWSSTEHSQFNQSVLNRYVYNGGLNIERMNYPKGQGYSIRCIKD